MGPGLAQRRPDSRATDSGASGQSSNNIACTILTLIGITAFAHQDSGLGSI